MPSLSSEIQWTGEPKIDWRRSFEFRGVLYRVERMANQTPILEVWLENPTGHFGYLFYYTPLFPDASQEFQAELTEQLTRHLKLQLLK